MFPIPGVKINMHFDDSCNECHCNPKIGSCCGQMHPEGVYDPLLACEAEDLLSLKKQKRPSLHESLQLKGNQRIIYRKNSMFEPQSWWYSLLSHQVQNRHAYTELKKELASCYCSEVAHVAWQVAQLKQSIPMEQLYHQRKPLTVENYRKLHALAASLSLKVQYAQELFKKIQQLKSIHDGEHWNELFDEEEKIALMGRLNLEQISHIKENKSLLDLNDDHLMRLIESCEAIKEKAFDISLREIKEEEDPLERESLVNHVHSPFTLYAMDSISEDLHSRRSLERESEEESIPYSFFCCHLSDYLIPTQKQENQKRALLLKR